MEVEGLVGKGWFQFPKNTDVLAELIELVTKPGDIVMDFYAGSGSTGHAVLNVNAKHASSRRFVLVQLPEPTGGTGYSTIAEISKERIRRAGKKILEGECHEGWNKDIGFRVLKIDSSNMADVYYTPDAIEQDQLPFFTDNIKPDRKPEDLLFQVLLDWGVDLSLPIRKTLITTENTEITESKKQDASVPSVSSVVKKSFAVFFVNEAPYDLVACFDTDVNEGLVKELARFEPLRVVFRDTGFVSDAVKINAEQIFKQLSPHTEVKAI